MCRRESEIFCRLAPDVFRRGGLAPAGSVWRRLRWRFRTPFVSLSAGAALVLAGRKIFGKFENDLRCGSFGTKFPDRIGAEGGNDRCGNIETLSQSDGGPF